MPAHVAVIMDGNGRWAEQRGLPRLEGHRAGVETVRSTIKRMDDLGVRYLTLYSFSTENWRRPQEEITGLFQLVEEMVDTETRELHRNNARLRHLGRLDGIPGALAEAIRRGVELTRKNTGLTVGFAFNYGAQQEIVDAVRHIASDRIPLHRIDPELFEHYLYTAGMPGVDLLIRTGGELRISNFLLWQSAYAELYFTEVLWPDFTPAEADKALAAYAERHRRFGGL